MLTQFLKRLIVLLLVAPAIAACATQNASSNHMREAPAVVAGVRARFDSDVPCSEHLGNLIDWAACMGLDASDPFTNTKYEDALILSGSLPDSSAGSLDLGSLIDLFLMP